MTPASVTDALSKYHRQWVQWGNGIGTHACLLNLVGFNKTVLEIGCNTGYLSSVMQQRGCQVTGVEIDPNAAESARSFCRRVIVGDAEKLDWETVLGDERFDVITFGDVLEHMRSPEAVLRQLRHHLTPTGYVVISLPNVAHGSICLSLLLGRFEYTPLGILDESHLRFYTRETAQQLLASGGFQVEDVWAIKEPVSPDLIGQVLSHFPRLDSAWVQDFLAREDAQAYQYVFLAVPCEKPGGIRVADKMDTVPTLSVVISYRGDEANLLSCLATLAADNVPLRQVIIVADVQPVLSKKLTSVKWDWRTRQLDEGYVHILNKTLASVDGDVVLLLDSEFVPQAGALDALVRHFEADATVGVVGSKVLAADKRTILQAGAYISPPVAQIAYRGAGYRAADERWSDVAEVDLIPLAMMAFRRALWQSLKGFDEDYSAHYFEADFCARVWAAGYRVLVEPKALAVCSPAVERTFNWLIGFHRDRLRFVRQHYGAGDWPDGFFEAETALLDQAQPGFERRAMRLAYLWQLKEQGGNCTGTQSFLSLYQRAKTLEARSMTTPLPRLQTYRFSSHIPLVGRLIAWFRALWGSIAARWYTESLVHQQNLCNQILSDRMGNLLEEFSELERLMVSVGTELADLRGEQGQRVILADQREHCRDQGSQQSAV